MTCCQHGQTSRAASVTYTWFKPPGNINLNIDAAQIFYVIWMFPSLKLPGKGQKTVFKVLH